MKIYQDNNHNDDNDNLLRVGNASYNHARVPSKIQTPSRRRDRSSQVRTPLSSIRNTCMNAGEYRNTSNDTNIQGGALKNNNEGKIQNNKLRSFGGSLLQKPALRIQQQQQQQLKQKQQPVRMIANVTKEDRRKSDINSTSAGISKSNNYKSPCPKKLQHLIERSSLSPTFGELLSRPATRLPARMDIAANDSNNIITKSDNIIKREEVNGSSFDRQRLFDNGEKVQKEKEEFENDNLIPVLTLGNFQETLWIDFGKNNVIGHVVSRTFRICAPFKQKIDKQSSYTFYLEKFPSRKGFDLTILKLECGKVMSSTTSSKTASISSNGTGFEISKDGFIDFSLTWIPQEEASSGSVNGSFNVADTIHLKLHPRGRMQIRIQGTVQRMNTGMKSTSVKSKNAKHMKCNSSVAKIEKGEVSTALLHHSTHSVQIYQLHKFIFWVRSSLSQNYRMQIEPKRLQMRTEVTFGRGFRLLNLFKEKLS